MSRRPTGSYDADDFHAIFVSVGVDNSQQCQSANYFDSVKSIFAILESVEIDPNMRIAPDARSEFERNAMLGLIDPVFLLVPFELHKLIT